MKIILAISLCWMLAACQATPDSSTAGKLSIPADLAISLERGLCRGHCPVYTVTIDSQGQVHFTGGAYVVFSNGTSQISQEQLEKLMAAVEASGFFAMQHTYEGMIDAPPSITTITVNDGTKRVFHLGNNGCNSQYDHAPQALCDLEDLIDEVTGTKYWIEGKAITPAAIPTSTVPSAEVIVIGRLESIQDTPGCGIIHWSAVAKYTDLQIASGIYPYDVVYVMHGCPELKRNEYAKDSGDLESFNVGDYHELHLIKQNIYQTMEHSNEPYPKDRLYFCQQVNYYKK